MSIKVDTVTLPAYDTVTLPAYWATALVNGDFSGMNEAETVRCNAAIDELAADGWAIVDVARDEDGDGQDPRFTWSYGLYDPSADCSGGAVLDYVIHKCA